MNDFARLLMPLVWQAAVRLAAMVVIAWFVIRLLRIRSPQVEQIVWFAVLLQGALLIPLIPIAVDQSWLKIIPDILHARENQVAELPISPAPEAAVAAPPFDQDLVAPVASAP